MRIFRMLLSSLRKLYVAGPMTGYPGFNYAAFRSAATSLRALGYTVEDPSEHFDGQTGLPREIYLASDVTALLTECWGVCLLEGWAGSPGARLEVALAQLHGLAVMEYLGPGILPRYLPSSIIRGALWAASTTA